MKIIRKMFICKRDELEIHGLCYMPSDSNNLPIAIISHEFMSNKLFTVRYAKMFAKMGYAAFCYDFCGGCIVGRSEGKTTEMSALTEIEDLKAVIKYAKAQAYVNDAKLTLMGCSQGGMVTALFAGQNQCKIDNLVLFYPALSVPDDDRKGHMIKAIFDPDNIPEHMNCGLMKLGKKYVTDVINMNVFDLIRGYHGNVMICHGNADTLVDISYSQKAVAEYMQSNKEALLTGVIDCMPKVKLQVIERGKHIFLTRKTDRDARKAVREFLPKYSS